MADDDVVICMARGSGFRFRMNLTLNNAPSQVTMETVADDDVVMVRGAGAGLFKFETDLNSRRRRWWRRRWPTTTW